MRIVSRSRLRDFWERQPGAEEPLRAWYRIVDRMQWRNPHDVRATFRTADVLRNGRVVTLTRIPSEHSRSHWAIAESPAIRLIKSDGDYRLALSEIDRLIDAEDGSPEGETLAVLSTLVADYEDRQHPIEAPDPIAFLEFVMESRCLTRRDLEQYIGSRSRVAEIMNRRRPLSIEMIRRLCAGLDLPADVLIQPYKMRPTTRAA